MRVDFDLAHLQYIFEIYLKECGSFNEKPEKDCDIFSQERMKGKLVNPPHRPYSFR